MKVQTFTHINAVLENQIQLKNQRNRFAFINRIIRVHCKMFNAGLREAFDQVVLRGDRFHACFKGAH